MKRLLCATLAAIAIMTTIFTTACQSSGKQDGISEKSGVYAAAEMLFPVKPPEKKAAGGYEEKAADGVKVTSEYNAEGYLVKQVSVSPEGEQLSCSEYEYDKNGRFIKLRRTNDQSVKTEIYTYNKKGQLVETRFESETKQSDGADSTNLRAYKTVFTYDAKGRLIKNSTCHENGDIYHESDYYYDEDAHKVIVTHYIDGNQNDEIYYYTDDWKQKKREGYSFGGNLLSVTEYDENQNKINPATKVPEDIMTAMKL